MCSPPANGSPLCSHLGEFVKKYKDGRPFFIIFSECPDFAWEVDHPTNAHEKQHKATPGAEYREGPSPSLRETLLNTECLLLISLRLLQTEHRCWCIHLRPWKRIVAATRLDKSKIDLDSIEVVSKSWSESFYVQQLSSIRTSATKVVQKENQIKWAFISIQLHDTTSTLAFIQVFGID